VNHYLISPAAKLDLLDIRDYLAKHGSRNVAARVLRDLRDAIQNVTEMPGVGHLRPDLAGESLRFYRVYKYLIIYRTDTSPLQVVRVLHGARDVRSILET
jgi:plasmid stabilization system protein ParE